MGWQLIRHAVAMIWRNRRDALKVSVGPLVIGTLAIFLLGRVTGLGGIERDILFGADPAALSPGAAGLVLVGSAIYLVVVSWIAVSWHRFVLIEDYPGLLPALPARVVAAYVWRSIVITFLLMLALVPVVLAVGVLSVVLGIDQTAIGQLGLAAVIGTVLGYLWLRIASVLPGLAVGRPLSIRGAWGATSALSAAIFGASALFVAFNILAAMLSAALFGAGPVRIVAEITISWATMMVGASLVTTVYGHAIEGRPLSAG